MVKHHNIISIFIGIGFFFVTRHFTASGVGPLQTSLAITVFLALATWYNYWYLRQSEKFNAWALARPTLFMLSAFWILLFIPSPFLRAVFLIVAASLAIFYEIFLGKFAENFLLGETLLTSVGFLLGFAALREDFPSRQLWAVIGVFVATALVTRSFYEYIPQSVRVRQVSALSIALFCSQVFWATGFLPFHFSALAVIVFNVFYFCLILNYYSFFQTLNRKKIYFHLIVMALSIGAVLLATPWKVLQ